MRNSYKLGDPVVFSVTKFSTDPGPRTTISTRRRMGKPIITRSISSGWWGRFWKTGNCCCSPVAANATRWPRTIRVCGRPAGGSDGCIEIDFRTSIRHWLHSRTQRSHLLQVIQPERVGRMRPRRQFLHRARTAVGESLSAARGRLCPSAPVTRLTHQFDSPFERREGPRNPGAALADCQCPVPCRVAPAAGVREACLP